MAMGKQLVPDPYEFEHAVLGPVRVSFRRNGNGARQTFIHYRDDSKRLGFNTRGLIGWGDETTRRLIAIAVTMTEKNKESTS